MKKMFQIKVVHANMKIPKFGQMNGWKQLLKLANKLILCQKHYFRILNKQLKLILAN